MAAAHQPEMIAAAVIEAAVRGDKEVAEKYNITTRTLRNWKHRVVNDDEVSAHFRKKKDDADRAWADQIPGCLSACIGYLKTAAEESHNKTPEMVHAIAGALKMVSEVAATWKVLDARLAERAGRTGAQVIPFAAGHSGGNGNGKAAAAGER